MPARPIALYPLLALLCALAGPVQAGEDAEVRALLARGDQAAALARASKYADANPRDVQARFLLGVVLMDSKRDDEALAHFTRMAQDYPELPDPYNNIALLHARATRWELARQALESALRNDPTHRTARANLGQVHLVLAVQAWEQAAAAGPVDAPLQRKLEGARALLASSVMAGR
jgi:Flp pilus assembly protein TadD